MRGLSIYSILLYRNIINLILNTGVSRLMGVKLYTDQIIVQRLLYLRMALSIGSSVFLFGSLFYISLGDQTVLIQLVTVWSMLLGYLILHENITRGNVISTGVSFLGIILVARPPFISDLF